MNIEYFETYAFFFRSYIFASTNLNSWLRNLHNRSRKQNKAGELLIIDALLNLVRKKTSTSDRAIGKSISTGPFHSGPNSDLGAGVGFGLAHRCA
jgi:hypothetical protein